MVERSIDLLGESFTLPEDLRTLQEDGGFPTRIHPSVLPDELRGALLLPSDSGSFTTGMTAETASWEKSDEHKSKITESYSSDLQGAGALSPDHSPRTHDVPAAALSMPLHAKGESPPPRVGLGGANNTPTDLSGSSGKSSKSRDWSLSDTDLRELLERGNIPDGPPGGMNPLSTVPEACELAGALDARLPPAPPNSEPQTEEGSSRSLASKSQDTLSGNSPARSHPGASPAHSQPGSSSFQQSPQRSLPGSSPTQSTSSRSQASITRVTQFGPVESSPGTTSQSGSGTTATPSTAYGSHTSSSHVSSSQHTQWSEAQRSQATIRSSATRGSGSLATFPDVIARVSERDLQEVSISSSDVDVA